MAALIPFSLFQRPEQVSAEVECVCALLGLFLARLQAVP